MLTETKRPILSIPESNLDWALEALAVLGLLSAVILLWNYWPQLPNRVPKHFGASGKVDAWGGKNLLYLEPALSFGLYILLTVVSRFPHKCNYPWPITEENAGRQYSLARTLLAAIKAQMVWLFTYLLWGTIQVALGRSEGLATVFLPATMAALFGTIAVYFYKAWKAR